MRVLFAGGHVARVVAVELADHREVVVKVREPSARVAAVFEVQRRLFDAGYPCPEPLVGPCPFDGLLATAEAYVPGGTLDGAWPPVRACADLLSELLTRTPSPQLFPELAPPPPWVYWDHPGEAVWPHPDDIGVDLNGVGAFGRLDSAGERVRARLQADDGAPALGHMDWEAHNIGWQGRRPVVVYDWDSLAIRTEPTIVGAAATVFGSSGQAQIAATLSQTKNFLDHYQRRRGPWTPAQREIAWAAGLWVLLYNARKETAGAGLGYLSHLDGELDDRLRRSGA